MSFSLEEFRASPSPERVKKCKKADLLAIANSYSIAVLTEERKPALKQKICKELVKQGVLPSPAAGDEAAEAADMLANNVEPHPVSDPYACMSAENLRLRLRIKEEETKQKWLEVEAQRLRFEALKLGGSPSSTPKPKSDEAEE